VLTALHPAVLKEHMSASSFGFTSISTLVDIVMCLGANALQYQDTALTDAAHNGHADCVRLLVEAGADKEVKSNVRDLVHILA
jgi:ankyrin repeat protein